MTQSMLVRGAPSEHICDFGEATLSCLVIGLAGPPHNLILRGAIVRGQIKGKTAVLEAVSATRVVHP